MSNSTSISMTTQALCIAQEVHHFNSTAQLHNLHQCLSKTLLTFFLTTCHYCLGSNASVSTHTKSQSHATIWLGGDFKRPHCPACCLQSPYKNLYSPTTSASIPTIAAIKHSANMAYISIFFFNKHSKAANVLARFSYRTGWLNHLPIADPSIYLFTKLCILLSIIFYHSFKKQR